MRQSTKECPDKPEKIRYIGKLADSLKQNNDYEKTN